MGKLTLIWFQRVKRAKMRMKTMLRPEEIFLGKKLRRVMYSSTTGMEVKMIPSPINLIQMMTIIKMTITSSRFSINKMHLE